MSFKFDEYKFYKNINTNKKTLINQLKLNELKQLENKNRLNENFKKEQKRIEKINKPILPNDHSMMKNILLICTVKMLRF